MPNQRQRVYTEHKTFRLEKSVYDKLVKDSKAYGTKNSSEYLRVLIQNRPADNPELRSKLDQLNYEMGKIGVNINQIVKNNNSYMYNSDDKQYLALTMESLNSKLKEIKRYCYSPGKK